MSLSIAAVTLVSWVMPSSVGAVVYTYWQAGTSNWSTGSSWTNGEPYHGFGTNGAGAYVNNGGTVQITNTGERCYFLNLGQYSGDSGYVSMSAGDLYSATSTYVGCYGNGWFTQTGGTNTVEDHFYVGDWSGSNGTYELKGGDFSAQWESVGRYGTGKFIQTGGTNTADWDLILGDESGSNGAYEISGGNLAVNWIFKVDTHGTFTVKGDDPVITVNNNYLQYGALQSHLDSGGISTISVGNLAAFYAGGTWDVVDLGGAPLGAFDILTADGGISGAPGTVNLPGPGWDWEIVSGAGNSETLRLTHVPEPASLSLLILGGLALMRRRRP
ncbi:MAG: PEP-CTERM sorting domain-containing protein [Planctomycetota bacterium]|nr:PEP-CTERM sorting domain-containing protein [Planctomycetota bacterium]